jgi:hypothetical protein
MYHKAVVYALTEFAEKAIEYLRDALAHGYSHSQAERDPDLASLRSGADYKTLFATKE